MRARIIGLAAAASLAVPTLVGHVPAVSAMSAQFWVTGYVLTGTTATGTYTHPGTCAVDPRVIPLGTYFYVSGIGQCHAEDTGGAVIGYHVDVWVPSVSEAYAITGWHTVTWGGQSQQVLGYQAAPPTATPSPPPPPPPPPTATATTAPSQPAPAVTAAPSATPVPNGSSGYSGATSHTYYHGNPYTHGATVPHTTRPVYTLISLHGQGCHQVHWTTYSYGQVHVHTATVCS